MQFTIKKIEKYIDKVLMIYSVSRIFKGGNMNPVFVFLVILVAVAIWFLLSFAFRPIGRFFYRIWKDAVDEINRNEESEEKKDER